MIWLTSMCLIFFLYLTVPRGLELCVGRVTGFAVCRMGWRARRWLKGARGEVTAIQVATPAMAKPCAATSSRP